MALPSFVVVMCVATMSAGIVTCLSLQTAQLCDVHYIRCTVPEVYSVCVCVVCACLCPTNEYQCIVDKHQIDAALCVINID